jgi:uncharacterized protein (TIGR03435 family)
MAPAPMTPVYRRVMWLDNRKLLAIVSSTMFVGSLVGGLAAKAQPPQSTAPAPSFEVASVKANNSGGLRNRFQVGRGGSFIATNCSPRLLIQYAFQVKRYQISNAPAWVTSDGYDVTAKAEGDPEIHYMPGMVKQLLEVRFQLRHHWETKEGAGYDLVVSKPGRLRQSEAGDCPSFLSASSSLPGAPPDPPCGYLPNTPGHTSGSKLTSASLADALAFFIQAPVVDKTKLTGKYDVDLQWTPESALMQSASPETAGPPLDETTGPSIFTALPEQLGLKLEPAKGPVQTLVIDHIERPSEN